MHPRPASDWTIEEEILRRKKVLPTSPFFYEAFIPHVLCNVSFFGSFVVVF